MKVLKILIGNSMMIILVAIVIIYFMLEIVAKIKNKTKKCKRQQITHQRCKNQFSIDYDKFINANFENITYLYENKNRKSELIRMIG